MDSLTFIAEIIQAIVWPVTIIFILLIIRKPMQLLLPQLHKIKYKDFEAEFGRIVEEVRKQAELVLPESSISEKETKEDSEKLYCLAEISANAAVIEAWRLTEKAAKKLVERRGYILDYDIATPYKLIERVLDKACLMEKKKIKIFSELRQLRNKVAHAGEFEVTVDQAKAYIKLALALKADFDENAG